MADAYKGQDQYLAVGFAANSLTDISGDDDGLVNFDLGMDTESIVNENGGEDGTTSQLRQKTYAPTLTTQMNDVTAQFFLPEHHGKTLYIEWGPKGNTAGQGNPKITLAIIQSVPIAAPTDGDERVTITGPIRVKPVFGTYA